MLTLFLAQSTPERNNWLHYVHQLVSKHVCLTFGAEQFVYGVFLELLHIKIGNENDTMRAVTVNQNRKV